MPELPEVETVRTGLEKLLKDSRVLGVRNDWPKSFPNTGSDAEAFLIGAKITTIRRRAKILLIDLDTGYSLAIHLKMTGQLVYRSKRNNNNFGAGHPSSSLIGELPDRSTRVILELEDAYLYFNDQRKFGWMRLLPTKEIEHMDFIKKLGPEPFAPDLDEATFFERLQRRKNSSVKAVLLDQTVIAGVGNIYADESLWRARIHPSTLVKNLKRNRLNNLFKELNIVLRLAIEKGGSTDKNYVNAEGKAGSYLSYANVFRRENLPCNRCGTIIQKSKIAGRGTHICPECQTP